MQFETAQGPIEVNVSNFAQLKREISNKIEHKQSFALATINLDHLVKLNVDAEFYRSYRAQDLVVADGNPIVWMSQIAGQKLQLLPGSDLVEPLCEQMANLGAPIALVGATKESLDLAADHLTSAFPKLEIVLKLSPPYGFDPASVEAEEVLSSVHASGARLCFLAFGAPKQEVLAARGKSIAKHTGFVSVGAGLDFLAGTQERAPQWVRNIGMEWLWRLLGNPKRMGARYAKCFAILPSHILRAFKLRRLRD